MEDGVSRVQVPHSGRAPEGAISRSGRVAQNLIAHRERAGLTQAQLAELARVSRATIALIESGNSDPKLSTLDVLAGAMSIEVSKLID